MAQKHDQINKQTSDQETDQKPAFDNMDKKSQETLQSPFGNFRLRRFPPDPAKTLRAWDAADEYILRELVDHLDRVETGVSAEVLVINDQFGALSTALAKFDPVLWSDSITSQQAAIFQRKQNNIDTSLDFIPATETPEKVFNIVLIKIPKNLNCLQDVLTRLRPCLDNSTYIIAGGMVKHWSSRTQEIFEQCIGSSHTSRAVKKARLLFSELDPALKPEQYISTVLKENSLDLSLSHESNVYGQANFDLGARILISTFDQFLTKNRINRIADLACGNGVLGVMLSRLFAQSDQLVDIDFIDESFMAINSAGKNAKENLGSIENLTFYISNGFDQVPDDQKYDLIICNPPFHQEHTITPLIANKLFRQSYEHLNIGGELRVVGNRHLNYHIHLKKLFGQAQTIASNKKFVVISAQRS